MAKLKMEQHFEQAPAPGELCSLKWVMATTVEQEAGSSTPHLPVSRKVPGMSQLYVLSWSLGDVQL